MTQRSQVDTTLRGSTFVYPDATPAELAPLPPAQAIQILPPAQIAVEDVLEGRIRAIERTSPLLQAQAFSLKYLGLSVVLCILAAGLVWQAGLPAPTFLVVFGGMSFAGYWLLGWMEAGHTTAGVERLRLREGSKVLRHKIDADRDVQLAQIDLQADMLEAQREFNRRQDERLQARIAAQMERHETPQTTANLHANYVPPDMGVSVNSAVSTSGDTGYTVAKPALLYRRDELEVPSFMTEKRQRRIADEARRTLTTFVASLYERDDAGAWMHLYPDGRIKRSVKTPMSARSGLAAPVRAQIDGILGELDRCGAWLIRYDDDQRLYRLNLSRFAAPDEAVDAIGDVPTMRMM